ncbi:MAG: DNA-processing protein DprA [Myxococcales bacterium]|nr:DNA-processing protein DprA [Myxococcales bacterium]
MARKDFLLDAPPRELLPGHVGWPQGLSALDKPPERLRWAGAPVSLEGALAVVGTRYADDDALRFARELGEAIAAEGRAVLSGGAFGVDAAAHEGALAAGGATVAVMATGFDRFYPARHRPLFQAIVHAGGALVTEQPDGVAPRPWAFLARNRLIAALAEAVVVVQAPRRSGALSTAAAARKLKKPVFAVPYAPWEVRGEGSLALLSGGAHICTSPRDVLSLRPHRRAPEPPRGRQGDEKAQEIKGLDEDGRCVFRALGSRPTHPDELAAKTGLAAPRIQRALFSLQLMGLAEQRDSGMYVRQRALGGAR